MSDTFLTARNTLVEKQTNIPTFVEFTFYKLDSLLNDKCYVKNREGK